jgi:hypothetical protein
VLEFLFRVVRLFCSSLGGENDGTDLGSASPSCQHCYTRTMRSLERDLRRFAVRIAEQQFMTDVLNRELSELVDSAKQGNNLTSKMDIAMLRQDGIDRRKAGDDLLAGGLFVAKECRELCDIISESKT